MQRRAVLRSAAVAATAGLAGCPAIAGGGSSGPKCGTPNGELPNALPRGGKYNKPKIDQNNSAEEVGGAARHVFASYQTNSEERYLFVIGEYDSAKQAQNVATDKQLWNTYGGEVKGSLVVDNYAYIVLGPSKGGVKDLMARADPINEACVEENVEFL